MYPFAALPARGRSEVAEADLAADAHTLVEWIVVRETTVDVTTPAATDYQDLQVNYGRGRLDERALAERLSNSWAATYRAQTPAKPSWLRSTGAH